MITILAAKLDKVSAWCKAVQAKATVKKGSWKKAAEFVCASGKEGEEGKKLVRINLDYTGQEVGTALSSNESYMCIYSMWGLIRKVNWEMEDGGEKKISDEEQFNVATLYKLVDNIKMDNMKKKNKES